MGSTETLIFIKDLWYDIVRITFDKYETLGRPILDFLHVIFQSGFNILLVITILMSSVFLVMTIYTLIRGRKYDEEIDENYKPFVTIQIPTYNELAAIRCAKACLNFDYPKDKFEILIGDDSNKVEVSEKLEEFALLHSSVKVVKRENNKGFKPGNLNNMLKNSNGEILVLFDSDFIPKSDFLVRIIQLFSKNENIAAVQAKWSFINQNQNMTSILGSTILNVYHYITLPFIKSVGDVSFLCGSAEAVRKSTLLKLGGWNSGNLTEDIEYSIRVINNGYKIKYLENLTCDSEVPYSPKDLYKQQMRWGYGVIFSFKKHFRSIFAGKLSKIFDKLCLGIVVSGYFLAFLLFGLFVLGFLSLITHRPEPIDWSRFAYEMIRNVLFTSGIIIASVVALIKSRNLKSLFPMLASSFSYGIVTTYYVNKGILKAIFGKPMQWYMLRKKGNENYN